MKLSVNGEEYATAKDTITELLKELQVVPGRVAVEVNHKVIKKSDFEDYRLNEGDNVEIVNFVGGGNHGRQVNY